MNNKNYKYFLIRFIKPHAHLIIIILFLDFISLLFSFANPLLMKYLVDDVFIEKKFDLFGYIILGTAGIYIVSAVSNFSSRYLNGKLELILFRYIAEDLFNSIQLASLKDAQRITIGDLISRIMSNTKSAIYIFTYIIPELLLNLVSIIIPIGIMFYLNYQLTLIITSPVLFFFLTSLYFGNILENRQKLSLEKSASIYSFLKETFSLIPLIKVFGLETWSLGRFIKQMEDYYNASMGYTRTSSLMSSVGSLIYGVPMILLILFGGSMVIQGSLTLGTFTAFISYVSFFFAPISQLSNLWTSYKSSSPAFNRISEIIQLKQDDMGKKELTLREGLVVFEDVWFSHENRPVLQGFNATFKKGLNYVIGDNGTGKSTILKLLCSLYPLDRGEITIDGQNISLIKKADLVNNISMIYSEPYLFDGSIYENIQVGDLSASNEEIIQAAKLVRVHEFVDSLSLGYETQVGEGGLKLSSGEKQKIALARAILKNSPILLLDEVTKSIDMESRKSINDSIKSLQYNKTIIIITHNINEIECNGNIVYMNMLNNV